MKSVWASLLGFAGLLVVPGLAHATDHYYCVDQSGFEIDFSRCPDPSCPDGIYPSIQEALVAAEAQPAATFSHICVASPAPHVETVDATLTSALGDELHVEAGPSVFNNGTATHLCPGVASPSGTPVFTLQGGVDSPRVLIRSLEYRPGLCTNEEAPLAAATDLQVEINLVVEGGLGPVLSGSSVDPDHNLRINTSLIEGISGSILLADAAGSIVDTEISGSVAEPGVPLVSVSGFFLLEHAALFNNAVSDGAPLMAFGGRTTLRDSLIAGNLLIGGGPAMDWTPSASPELQILEMEDMELSRNSVLGTGTVPTPSTIPRQGWTPGPFDHCLPTLSVSEPYEDRVVASTSAVPTVGALIRLDPSAAASSDHVAVWLHRTSLVGNDIAEDGSLVQVVGDLPNLTVGFTHCLVDEQTPPAAASPVWVLDGGGTGQGGDVAVVSARNLLLGQPRARFGSAWGRAEVTLDLVEDDPALWHSDFGALAGIVGPAAPPLDWADAFWDASAFLAEDDCAQVEFTCGETPDACNTLPPAWRANCPLDLALNYVLKEPAASESAVPWPWDATIIAPLEAGDPLGVVGPQGGVCVFSAGAIDDDGLGSGDNDGFTNLTDCDNESALVTPQLPPSDGFNGPCDSGYDCYDCSVFPGDDDDATADDDSAADDDAATADDDDVTADDDDATPTDSDGDGDPDFTDCDDNDPTIYNGAPDPCDLVGSDCDGDLLEGQPDLDLDGDCDENDPDVDGDGEPNATDCAPEDADIHPGAPNSATASTTTATTPTTTRSWTQTATG